MVQKERLLLPVCAWAPNVSVMKSLILSPLLILLSCLLLCMRVCTSYSSRLLRIARGVSLSVIVFCKLVNYNGGLIVSQNA